MSKTTDLTQNCHFDVRIGFQFAIAIGSGGQKMTEKKIKTHTVLAAIFILTTFVTACVKNSGKGPGEPEVVQSAKIDSEHLNPNGEDGTIRAIIQADLTNPTEVISKDFTIQLNEISEVQVRRGAVNNENCGKNDLAPMNSI